jgi:hypothetical protein
LIAAIVGSIVAFDHVAPENANHYRSRVVAFITLLHATIKSPHVVDADPYQLLLITARMAIRALA